MVVGLLGSKVRHFNTEECKVLLAALSEYHAKRQSLDERTTNQRVIDENHSWRSHLRWIVADWGGEEQYTWALPSIQTSTARIRLLMAQLALRTHYLEEGSLPSSLDALVPEYLPQVPQDPFSNGPLRAKREKWRFTIYSVGPDGIDQTASPSSANAKTDDIKVSDPVY